MHFLLTLFNQHFTIKPNHFSKPQSLLQESSPTMSDYKPTGISPLFHQVNQFSHCLLPISNYTLLLFCCSYQYCAYTNNHDNTEHDGKRQDGQPDGRVGTGQFAQGKVEPHEAGKQGGSPGGSAGGEQHKPTENDGSTKSGEPDGRVKGN